MPCLPPLLSLCVHPKMCSDNIWEGRSMVTLAQGTGLLGAYVLTTRLQAATRTGEAGRAVPPGRRHLGQGF